MVSGWKMIAKCMNCLTRIIKKLFALHDTRHEWIQTTYNFPQLKSEVLENLQMNFKYEEIKYSMFSMNPWEEPWLDGFPVGFYQKSWSVVVPKCVSL